MGINQSYNEQNPPTLNLNQNNPLNNENNSLNQNGNNNNIIYSTQPYNNNNNEDIKNSINKYNSYHNPQIILNQDTNIKNLEENKINQDNLSINVNSINENLAQVKIINNNQIWEKNYNKDELIETIIKDYIQENNLNISENIFKDININNKKINFDDKISVILGNNVNEIDKNNENNENNNHIKYYDITHLIRKSVELSPLDAKFSDLFGKPFYEPFEISLFIKNEKKFKLLKYPKELIEKTKLFNFGITSAYCNGYNCLYLSGGENCLNNFWIINLKEKILNEPIDIPPKKNHSMIYIPKSTIFFVGGQTLDTFYYNLNENRIIYWGNLNFVKIGPALIAIKNKLYCIDTMNNNKINYTFEVTELTSNEGKWEIIKPKLSYNINNRIFNQQIFGVTKDYDDNIIFLGGSLTDNKKDLNFKYNYKSNIIELSHVKYKKFILKEKTFYALNKKYDCILTDFRRDLPQIAFYNKKKGKIELINFASHNSSRNMQEENQSFSFREINGENKLRIINDSNSYESNSLKNNDSNSNNNNYSNENEGESYKNKEDNNNLNNYNKINSFLNNNDNDNNNDNNTDNNKDKNYNYNNNNYNNKNINKKNGFPPGVSFYKKDNNNNINNNINNNKDLDKSKRNEFSPISFYKNNNNNYNNNYNFNNVYDNNNYNNNKNLNKKKGFWPVPFYKYEDNNINPNNIIINNNNVSNKKKKNDFSPGVSFYKSSNNNNNINIKAINNKKRDGFLPGVSFYKNNNTINNNNNNNIINKRNRKGFSPSVSFYKNMNKNKIINNFNNNLLNNNINSNKNKRNCLSPSVNFWKKGNINKKSNITNNDEDEDIDEEEIINNINVKSVKYASPSLSFWENVNDINRIEDKIDIGEKSPKDNLRNASPGLSFWENNSNDMNLSNIKNNSEINDKKYLNNIKSTFPNLTYWERGDSFNNNKY